MICTPTKYWGDQVKDSGKGGVCGICGGKEQFMQGFEEETRRKHSTEEVLALKKNSASWDLLCLVLLIYIAVVDLPGVVELFSLASLMLPNVSWCS